MSDEFGWRPLGCVVNRVLQDVKVRAARNGSFQAVTARPEPRTVQTAPFAPDGSAEQLELPFGIAPLSAPKSFGTAGAPRGVRLM